MESGSKDFIAVGTTINRCEEDLAGKDTFTFLLGLHFEIAEVLFERRGFSYC